MTYFVGVDGGQSSTVAVVGDERGYILGRATAGPADEIGQGPDSTRLCDALRFACDAALHVSGASLDARCVAIVAGVSGYEGVVHGVAPTMPTDRFVLMHDAPIAHAGAFAGGPGAMVIAGTGSVAFAVDEHGGATVFGGWGYLFGDEGSAFWIAREAIVHATRHPDCACVPQIVAFFGRASLREVVRDVYRGVITRDRVAAFAVDCVASTRLKRLTCYAAIVDKAVHELVALAQVSTMGLRGGAARVSYVGGLTRDAWFTHLVYELTRSMLSNVEIVEPRYEPACGALLLAYKEGGLMIQELIG